MELNWDLILLYESVLETRDRLSKFEQVLGHIIDERLGEYDKKMEKDMPQFGEVRYGREIGKAASLNKFIWVACEVCGRGKWDRVSQRRSKCADCARGENSRRYYKEHKGDKSPQWKGGSCHNGDGYVLIYLQPDDFFYPMANAANYVLEHRLVMAKHLGRCLQSWEIVHHKNHIKDDNRIGNLQLVSDDRHKQISILEAKIGRLQQENKKLKLKVSNCEKET